jgi:antitoxin component HigA of HigAB toxin-antitoxin module
VDILNYIMKLEKFNQSQLSNELQISKSALSEILAGKKKPGLDVARILHQRFNIDGNLLLSASI